MLTKHDVSIPLDVPSSMHDEYVANFLSLTRSTGKLVLFAGDQKIEHLNSDFYGQGIADEDSDPEHLFKIAYHGTVGCFAAQMGLIARYGRQYPGIGYLVKLNSKTNLVETKQRDPVSRQIWTVDDVVRFKKESGLRVLAVGYTLYLGSEYEADMLTEAGRLISEAHKHGLLTVLWIYPRGKSVLFEKDPHIIAGACGTALCLGSDFVKVNYPSKYGFDSREMFKEAIKAAGNTGVVCAGGSKKGVRDFLQDVHDQIYYAGGKGNATGRNVHQRPLDEAIRLCDAISAITYGGWDVDGAMRVYEGHEQFKL
ncbi:aldolase [Candidatus Woesearchaeota archaeon]|nr:aldolase [Candidatus Woesearchaeota archaeon]